MGALTSFANWNPEDDLLLKNAVEAGASLESLAKGAVKFSRRFTLREVEERWRALLYDLSTSIEASARVIEIEIGVPVSNPCKPSRVCNLKAKENLSDKRRGESLRSHYLATRKKLRGEQHISASVGFSMPPSSHAFTGNCNGSHDLFKLQNELVHFKFPVDGLSDNHVFAKVTEVDSSAATNNHVFSGGIVGLVDTKLPDELSGRDCLYRHAEDKLDEPGYNNSSQNFDRNHFSSQASDGSDSNQTHSLVLNNPGVYGDLELKHSKGFVSTNHNQDNVPAVFGGSDKSTSEFEGCSSFHQLGYSSPPPGRPIWKTVEDVSTPSLQMDGKFEEKVQGALTMDHVKKLDDQGCDVSPKDKQDHVTSDTTSNDPTVITDPNFIDFSTACMRFTDDEELMFIDVDEEDIDRSCLNGLGSILLNSPVDNHIDNSTIVSEPKPLEISDTAIPACNEESFTEDKTVCGDTQSGSSIHHSSVAPGVSIVSLPSKSSEKFAICVVNTEDLDVPINDDVSLPIKALQASVTTDLKQDVSTTMPNDAKASSGSSNLIKEEKVMRLQPSKSNMRTGQALLQKVDSLHSTASCVVENVISREAGVANKDVDGKSSILPAIVSHSAPVVTLKEETATELDVQPSMSKRVPPGPPHSEPVSAQLAGTDQPQRMSVSDHEGQFSDDDDDDDDNVPNFSDVEAMVMFHLALQLVKLDDT
ncbi:hypothetical protein AXF42_Ash019970 [Apostasia shenzhenica]|uniref:Microspherule protein N-terminal domain-containing protein n=1 Tax=Apostasia shenzhenica TaxID=1088818 RepID=A0A2I0AZL1_9ASPA|nr:hypothetical protein AXF42_Ash019970 [Apostasia shenzhenica]